jgi:NDP-sugar pyrophosphorylase family protein
LKIFDIPLVIWNINILNKIQSIDSILIPEKYSETFALVKERFPSIHVDYSKDPPNSEISNHNVIKKSDFFKLDRLVLSVNSVIFQSKETSDVFVDTLVYPWDYLKSIRDILNNHVFESKISPTAKISKTTVIEGPCIIDENVVIDDFCKIKGPIFIGKDSFIGMGSLVRNCMMGKKTSIGFNCEISKCYFSGHTEIAHHNVILDSLIGSKVWFGGYSGTANVLLTKENVKYKINDNLVDTGINHFGAVVGDNSSVGAAVIILPGRQLPSNSSIQAGTIFGKK